MDLLNELFKSPNDIFLLGLDPFEFVIYSFLLRLVNENGVELFPSIRKIAAVCNMNKNTVEKKLKSMEEKGIIEIYKYQNKNCYRLLPIENTRHEKQMVFSGRA
ncbi:helix-turn-helix domain-containing protein [Aneurinibacillus tyrosinisolvens]|uniref:helix-turn-helix domain-containing protein n=1 Tax=Aneurinibacillus tyrosinisolvens TaxID=1443435 RepID=UPI00069AD4B3|nr:helix-turn-helix domain-containing protein [Aneurinibacillus tyrosinisolvens]